MTGRPSGYTDELAAIICARVAEGESVRAICRGEDMPSESMLYRWLADENRSGFREKYARAKEACMERYAEEILEIADDGSNDWIKRELDSGAQIEVPDHEHIQRSRLRVDSRKWLMSKLAPKKYGDKLDLEHSGSVKVEKVVREIVRPNAAHPDSGGVQPASDA